MNILIRWFGKLWNPQRLLLRDENGKVIDDWQRRRHSANIEKKPDFKKRKEPVCYQVDRNGSTAFVKRLS